ncbi:MAG: glucoamylase family protein, partial [Kiritimatiellae bacterium]|nr:glucoamylase family protein [Kiritimatiellia bacterium]
PPLTGPVNRDAVLCPAAAIASIPLTPAYSLNAIKAMHTTYSNELWGEYGFYESFSPKNSWFNRSYTTVHQGILMSMLANAEDGFIHHLFMSNPEISEALHRVGFTGMLDDFEAGAAGYPPAMTIEPSSAYSVLLTSESAAEGQRALQITYQKEENRNEPLALIPALHDFSPYRYLAAWVKGNAEYSFLLEDENGKTAAVGRMIQGPKFNEWRKVYYPLPDASPECNLSAVRRILLQAEPGNPHARGICFLDHLHLANILTVVPPEAPTLLHALPSRMPGELTLNWRQEETPGAQPVFRYHARYANAPIRDERAFQRATPLPGTEKRPLAASDLSCATRLSPSIHPYYIALRAEDISGARSDIVCTDPITLADQTPPPEFPLEQFDDAPPFLRWISPGPVLTAERTTDASLEGSGCLEISYCKETEADRWACLTALPDIRDMSQYRYLSMWVAGRADFVLRFIDLHGAQQDTSLEHAINPNAWSPLFFDLSKLTKVDRSAIDRILFFVEPDKINIAGTVYVDSISLSNTRN